MSDSEILDESTIFTLYDFHAPLLISQYAYYSYFYVSIYKPIESNEQASTVSIVVVRTSGVYIITSNK